ncbi:MAG TPA: hypothetical protein VGE74_31515, partial [Gemmata sp.]
MYPGAITLHCEDAPALPPASGAPTSTPAVPQELMRRLSESFGSMSPWGWPALWQAYQDGGGYGPGGSPYRGASGTTNDRAF